MGDECEMLGIKTASIFFHFLFSNSFMVYLIHVFICSVFWNTDCVLGLVLMTQGPKVLFLASGEFTA